MKLSSYAVISIKKQILQLTLHRLYENIHRKDTKDAFK
jgi:hypothetical protein